MLADGFFKVIPNLLGDHRDIILWSGADSAENLHPIGAIFPGDADAGDDGKAQSLRQSDVQGGHAGFQAKTIDDRGGATWFDVQIRQQASVSLALQAFHQAQHGPLLGNDDMA